MNGARKGDVTMSVACAMVFGLTTGAMATDSPTRSVLPATSLIQPTVSEIELIGTRSFDGTGNNLTNPDWGATHIQLRRLVPNDYADGTSIPSGIDRPSARAISTIVCEQFEPRWNAKNASDFTWQWGQFIDHDLDLTPGQLPEEPFDILVPPGDPFFDPDNTGMELIPLIRSAYDPATGTDSLNPREQRNELTAWLDGSMVYGANELRAMGLRRFDGTGKLKTSEGELLPFNVDQFPNDGGTTPTFFFAGDLRANEQTGLAAMHTLFVREHNFWADYFGAIYPFLDEESRYQLARIYTIAVIQVITFEEFLPVLVGDGAIPPYSTYNPEIDPGIVTEFSTACYRFGHSMLPQDLLRLDADGNAISHGHLPLMDAFFNPERLTEEGGIEPILRGLAAQVAQDVDPFIQDSIRNFLFGPPGAGGFDLAALNIQRGRDHGIPSYNAVRVAIGLDPVESFSDITADPQLAAVLEAAYGDVDLVDLWVGGIAEDHVNGGLLGETNAAVILDQFIRIRDGDRQWYERLFPPNYVARFKAITLADVIRRNTAINDEIQDNVFYVPTNAVFCAADVAPQIGDGRVNIDDLFAILNTMGAGDADLDIAPVRSGSIRGDGVVDHSDLIEVLLNFGPCPTTP